MAEYVQIAKEYDDRIHDTARVTMKWAKLLPPTGANWELSSGPKGIAAVYTIYFPFTDAGESATSGTAPTAGTKVAVSHSITMGERNSKKLTVHNLATLTATTPQTMEVVRQLVHNYITEINTQVKTYAVDTIPDSGNYTHEVNNSGAGGAQDVITAGYVYLGNDVSASESALTSVVAGDILTPAIFRKMVSTLRARDALPLTFPNGMDMFMVAMQREQMDYMKAHADYKANVNAPLGQWSEMQVIYGADSFYYEGCYIIPVDDATFTGVGAGGTDTGHYVMFMGYDFLGAPFMSPDEIQLSNNDTERTKLFERGEIRMGASYADAPLNKTKLAAWLYTGGWGIVNPLSGIRLILHSDAS